MAGEQTREIDFFISRRGSDADDAQWIAHILEEANHNILIQDWDFPAGSSFLSGMHDAIVGGARLVVCLSEEWQQSDWCIKELAATLAQAGPLSKTAVLVFRIKPCTPKGILADVAYVDLVGADKETARQKVLTAAKGGRLKPVAPPDAPSFRPALGALISNLNTVPFDEHLFTGREAEIKAVHDALTSGKTAAVMAVKGHGGIGKSTLARAYAERFADEYEGIWWVRAEKPDTLLTDLGLLAERLDPALAGQPVTTQAVEAMRRVSASPAVKPWLIILDNVQDQDAVRKWRAGGKARTLVTTRFRALDGVKSIDVSSLPDAEAAELILAASGRDNTAAALSLAKKLGGLPLALKQAGAYLRERPTMTFEAYERHANELMEKVPAGSDYPASAAATFDQAIAAAEEKAPGAAGLMGLISFFAPDAIPEGLLAAAEEFAPEGLKPAFVSDLTFADALDALWRYSLLDRKPEGNEQVLSVHRLVQDRVRGRMDAPTRDHFARCAVDTLDACFPDVDFRNWARCARLAPHVQAAAALVGDAEGGDRFSRLLNQTAVFLRERADYAGAEPLMRRALAMVEAAHGPKHGRVATSLNNLAVLLEEGSGKYEESERLKRRALEIDEGNYGPDHPNVAIRLNNIAVLLNATDRLKEAEPLMRRALAIDEKTLGPDHPDVATDLNNLAQVLKDTGRLEEAEPLMRRALVIDENKLGHDHPSVARDLNNLAGLLNATSRTEEALPMAARAVQIARDAMGSDHPSTRIYEENYTDLSAAVANAQARPTMTTSKPAARTPTAEPPVAPPAAVKANGREKPREDPVRRMETQARKKPSPLMALIYLVIGERPRRNRQRDG